MTPALRRTLLGNPGCGDARGGGPCSAPGFSAPGLGVSKNVSNWARPPAIQSKMHKRGPVFFRSSRRKARRRCSAQAGERQAPPAAMPAGRTGGGGRRRLTKAALRGGQTWTVGRRLDRNSWDQLPVFKPLRLSAQPALKAGKRAEGGFTFLIKKLRRGHNTHKSYVFSPSWRSGDFWPGKRRQGPACPR